MKEVDTYKGLSKQAYENMLVCRRKSFAKTLKMIVSLDEENNLRIRRYKAQLESIRLDIHWLKINHPEHNETI